MGNYIIQRLFKIKKRNGEEEVQTHHDIILKCDCSSPEHTVFVEMHRWTSDPEPTFYIFTSLSDMRFFKRLWLGIKYIFGYKCRYGQYQETVVFLEEMVEFHKALGSVLKEAGELMKGDPQQAPAGLRPASSGVPMPPCKPPKKWSKKD